MGIPQFLTNRAKRQAVSGLKKLSTEDQIALLSQSLDKGWLSTRELRRQLERNAPNEMRKGRDRILREGKTPTVDLLLEEYRSSGLKPLAERVGLDEAWFVALAEQYAGRER